MRFFKTKIGVILILTLIISATSYADNEHQSNPENAQLPRLNELGETRSQEKARMVEEYTRRRLSQVPKELLQNPDLHLPIVCKQYKEELNAIRSCKAASECGQVLAGTSCGCTRDKVARIDADLTKFERLKKEFAALVSISKELPPECDGIGSASICDCPETDGFACKNHLCTWNYRKVEPWGGEVKPYTP